LQKYSNIKFCENSYIGSRLFHADGRWTARHDESNSHFRNFANASENGKGV